jgi:hypothetical protein
MSHFLGFLDRNISGAPRDVVEVVAGVDLQEEVHGWHHQVVDES